MFLLRAQLFFFPCLFTWFSALLLELWGHMEQTALWLLCCRHFLSKLFQAQSLFFPPLAPPPLPLACLQPSWCVCLVSLLFVLMVCSVWAVYFFNTSELFWLQSRKENGSEMLSVNLEVLSLPCPSRKPFPCLFWSILILKLECFR